MAQRGRKPSEKLGKTGLDKLVCGAKCGKEKPIKDFFVSYNPIHASGRIPYCKKCLKEMCFDSNGNLNIEKVKVMLKFIDKPFIYDLFKTSAEDKNDTIGTYMKNIAMPQYRSLGWRESIVEPQTNDEINNSDINDGLDFKVTKEMILKWGSKYEPEDYYELEQFYKDMMDSNNIETASDKAYLKKLSVISLKMDKALQESNSGEVKQLGDLFSKYMADSKFRAMDKTDADKTGGIRNFSSIYAEVEKDGFIPPWEHYRKIKGITQDIVDKTIMHIENFTLKLNRVEKMLIPPSDTPKLENNEIDTDNIIEINDIEVDRSIDDILVGEEDVIME